MLLAANGPQAPLKQPPFSIPMPPAHQLEPFILLLLLLLLLHLAALQVVVMGGVSARTAGRHRMPSLTAQHVFKPYSL